MAHSTEEQIQLSALEDSARNLRKSAESCIEQTTQLRHALAAYREMIDDDVSENVAQIITAVSRRFDKINAAYANAYLQLGTAAEMLSLYESLGK